MTSIRIIIQYLLTSNDIALLKLAGPVTLNNNIQVACLPRNPTDLPFYYPPDLSTVIAVGWGTQEELGNISILNIFNSKFTEILTAVLECFII